MRHFFKFEAIFIGLAMFSMFFGAGNIIYPLAVGQHAGDNNIFAISGLIITAAFLPICGVIGMILFDGSTRDFFGRLGRIPGLFLAFATISLLGPLGSTPRCIALAYTTLKTTLPPMSMTSFSALSCLLILICTLNKRYILNLLGKILTPFLLFSLFLIIILGLLFASEPSVSTSTAIELFSHGLYEGYNTMDLLAAFFFSSTIVAILKKRSTDEQAESAEYRQIAYQASLIAAILLSIVYIGFSFVASYHGMHLTAEAKDALLAAITMRIAGPYAGILVCAAIALACLTTAIALISAFTDFVRQEIFQEKISYEITLIGALLLTFFVSTFEFTGISAFLWPILQIFYPGLIVLTLLNIAYKLTGFKPLKIPVFATFGLSVLQVLI